MTYPFKVVRALIDGILTADNHTKQELGRRFAFLLGFTPGPRGADDGVDGLLVRDDRKIHFQSKLSRTPLDKDEARKYYSDIEYHGATASIMLAGNGYKDTFKTRLFGHPGADGREIHLLVLEDVICSSQSYQAALLTLPELVHLNEVNWDDYRP